MHSPGDSLAAKRTLEAEIRGRHPSTKNTGQNPVKYFYDWARAVLLETSLAAQTEGKPCLAKRSFVGVGEVVTVPDNDFRIHGGVEVVVHAQELEVVFVYFAVRIVVFVRNTQGVLLMNVEAGLDCEQHLVVGHELFCGRIILVRNGVEERGAQIENGVVHAGFQQEGVGALALVRMESPNGVDTVVELFEALGVVYFGTQNVGVGATDVLTEHPVEARLDNQVFVGVVQEREGVGGEHGNRVVRVVGGAQVEGALAVLFVTYFGTETAEAFFAGNDGVAGGVAPEVIVECTGAVGHVTENKGNLVTHIPAELDAVKIEGVVAAIRTHGGGTSETVADFRFFQVAVFVYKSAMGGSHDDHGNVFVEVGVQGEVNVLVAGVGRVKIAVKIAGVVHVHIAVDLNVGGEGQCGGRGNCQWHNQFAHISFQYDLKFLVQR